MLNPKSMTPLERLEYAVREYRLAIVDAEKRIKEQEHSTDEREIATLQLSRTRS